MFFTLSAIRATRTAAAGVAAALALVATPLTPAGAEGVDVAKFRNHNGICETPADNCNFDDVGYGYSGIATTLAGVDGGDEFEVNGFTYTWPDAAVGAADNITLVNQVIPINAVDATRIGFLGASHHGPITAPVILHYLDEDDEKVLVTKNLQFSDWTLNGGSASPVAGNVTAITAQARSFSGAAVMPTTTYVFSLAVAIEPTMTLTHVEMPRERSVHLFDITVA